MRLSSYNNNKIYRHSNTFIVSCRCNSVFPKLMDANILLRSRVCNIEITFRRICKRQSKLFQRSQESKRHRCAFGLQKVSSPVQTPDGSLPTCKTSGRDWMYLCWLWGRWESLEWTVGTSRKHERNLPPSMGSKEGGNIMRKGSADESKLVVLKSRD